MPKIGDKLREKTISAMIWSGVGMFGATVITFVSNIVLARLLMPEDFGCLGLLQIFIAVGDAFVAGGFGQALIQKKNPTNIDFSTVFIWNIIASVVVYIVLFYSAPAISRFYRMPILCKLLRIQSLVLLIHAFIVVQNNQLRKDLRFKELSVRNVSAALLGTIAAIIVAASGGGVWSLVVSSLVSSIVNVVLLWNMSSWRPTIQFSWNSFWSLFSFGGLLALSDVLERFFANVQGVVIGKWYSATDMGYYSQANKLEEVPIQTLSQIVSQVSFPVFSELQGDLSLLKAAVKKNINTLVFINFPLCILMLIIASPLIHLLYGIRWEDSIPFFQILCVGGLVHSINSMNMNVVKALGKGKAFFSVQLTKRLFRFTMIVIGAAMGIKGLLWGVVISQYFNFVLNAFINQKYIGYGFFAQIKDVGLTLIIAIISGVCGYYIVYVLPGVNQYLLMAFQIVVFTLLYLLGAIVFKLEALNTYQGILYNYFRRVMHK